jgi:hypothetical protein
MFLELFSAYTLSKNLRICADNGENYNKKGFIKLPVSILCNIERTLGIIALWLNEKWESSSNNFFIQIFWFFAFFIKFRLLMTKFIVQDEYRNCLVH